MKKSKSSSTTDLKIPLSELSYDDFEDLMNSGEVEQEVPFDFLAEHYPELLWAWYPGYPGNARDATSADPTPMRGRVTDGILTVETPGIKPSSFPVEDDIPDGTYYLWASIDDDKNATITRSIIN
jgi:hypothetical protein